jgi:iron complex outermembrane recepter protein
VIGGSYNTQYTPATQESVLAYEAGLKTTQFNRTLQLTGAVFYYDYKDKQVLGVFNTGIFGAAATEVNIPKSSEKGAELQATWLPLSQLTLSAGITYLDSKIDDNFNSLNLLNQTVNVKGEAFPFTPRWSGVLDAEYHWTVPGQTWSAFVGASSNSQSASNAELGDLTQTYIGGYTLVDLRAGARSDDGTWRLTFWTKNVGDKYYWNDASKYQDTFVRFTGMPRTYGVNVNYQIR